MERYVRTGERKLTSIRLTWRDLKIDASPTSSIEILKRVSGYAETGNVIGIIGPSGAGKTTFLAALAGKIPLTSGSIKLNGYTIQCDSMSKISCYLPQIEILPSTLTPREYMLFMCALKMDKNSCAEIRNRHADKLLKDIGLSDCKDQPIKKLSGGERKRLSLCRELVTEPKIYFLDEPTTGLDIFAALNLVESLKSLAYHEAIVFCTIHQPSMAIYGLFSHITLLADGKTAFHGSTKDVADFFESQGFFCPFGFDESEYYVHILSKQNDLPKTCEAFSHAVFFDDNEDDDDDDNGEKQSFSVNSIHLIEKPGWTKEFRWIMWRIWTQNKRRRWTECISWFSYLLSILAIGTFYYAKIAAASNSEVEEGVQNARGALYLMTSEIIFTVAYSVVYELPSDLLLCSRESSLYGTGTYFLASAIVSIPKAFLKALVFTFVFVCLLPTSSFQARIFALPYYLVCTCAAAVSGLAYGTAISAWIIDVEVATTVMSLLDMFFLLTAGMFYNLRSLPFYLKFLKYLSIFYYANEAIAIVHWSTKVSSNDYGNSDILREYGYDPANFYWDLLGLFILTISLNVFGYFGLKKKRADCVAY